MLHTQTGCACCYEGATERKIIAQHIEAATIALLKLESLINHKNLTESLPHCDRNKKALKLTKKIADEMHKLYKLQYI